MRSKVTDYRRKESARSSEGPNFLRITHAFTLLELIIVVIIIGVLLSLSLPAFTRTAEKGRYAEGVLSLGTLRQAQVRHFHVAGAYTWDRSCLDIDNPNNLRFFTVSLFGRQCSGAGPTIAPPFGSCDMSALAGVTRNNVDNSGFGSYELYINENGTICCTARAGARCP